MDPLRTGEFRHFVQMDGLFQPGGALSSACCPCWPARRVKLTPCPERASEKVSNGASNGAWHAGEGAAWMIRA